MALPDITPETLITCYEYCASFVLKYRFCHILTTLKSVDILKCLSQVAVGGALSLSADTQQNLARAWKKIQEILVENFF